VTGVCGFDLLRFRADRGVLPVFRRSSDELGSRLMAPAFITYPPPLPSHVREGGEGGRPVLSRLSPHPCGRGLGVGSRKFRQCRQPSSNSGCVGGNGRPCRSRELLHDPGAKCSSRRVDHHVGRPRGSLCSNPLREREAPPGLLRPGTAASPRIGDFPSVSTTRTPVPHERAGHEESAAAVRLYVGAARAVPQLA